MKRVGIRNDFTVLKFEMTASRNLLRRGARRTSRSVCALFLAHFLTFPLTEEVARAAFFQEAVQQNGNKALDLEAIQAKIRE